MARGNQRDKAREANQKKLADQVSERSGNLSLLQLGIIADNDASTEEGKQHDGL